MNYTTSHAKFLFVQCADILFLQKIITILGAVIYLNEWRHTLWRKLLRVVRIRWLLRWMLLSVTPLSSRARTLARAGTRLHRARIHGSTLVLIRIVTNMHTGLIRLLKKINKNILRAQKWLIK